MGGDVQGVALVTGANRGLGFEVCKQLGERGYAVVLSARSLAKAEAAVGRLTQELNAKSVLVPAQLEVRSENDVSALALLLRERFGRLDMLVNNAGVFLDDRELQGVDVDLGVVRDTFENNTIAVLRVTQALLPLVRESGGGNIVNVSSGFGSLSEMGSRYTGYRLSKVALNGLTRILHTELHQEGVRVNSVCPGWVRTDMGGAAADRSVAEGASGIVWAATLGEGGPSGGFFRDGQPIEW